MALFQEKNDAFERFLLLTQDVCIGIYVNGKVTLRGILSPTGNYALVKAGSDVHSGLTCFVPVQYQAFVANLIRFRNLYAKKPYLSERYQNKEYELQLLKMLSSWSILGHLEGESEVSVCPNRRRVAIRRKTVMGTSHDLTKLRRDLRNHYPSRWGAVSDAARVNNFISHSSSSSTAVYAEDHIAIYPIKGIGVLEDESTDDFNPINSNHNQRQLQKLSSVLGTASPPVRADRDASNMNTTFATFEELMPDLNLLRQPDCYLTSLNFAVVVDFIDRVAYVNSGSPLLPGRTASHESDDYTSSYVNHAGSIEVEAWIPTAATLSLSSMEETRQFAHTAAALGHDTDIMTLRGDIFTLRTIRTLGKEEAYGRGGDAEKRQVQSNNEEGTAGDSVVYSLYVGVLFPTSSPFLVEEEGEDYLKTLDTTTVDASGGDTLAKFKSLRHVAARLLSMREHLEARRHALITAQRNHSSLSANGYLKIANDNNREGSNEFDIISLDSRDGSKLTAFVVKSANPISNNSYDTTKGSSVITTSTDSTKVYRLRGRFPDRVTVDIDLDTRVVRVMHMDANEAIYTLDQCVEVAVTSRPLSPLLGHGLSSSPRNIGGVFDHSAHKSPCGGDIYIPPSLYGVAHHITTLLSFLRHVRAPGRQERARQVAHDRDLALLASAATLESQRFLLMKQVSDGCVSSVEAALQSSQLQARVQVVKLNPPGMYFDTRSMGTRVDNSPPPASVFSGTDTSTITDAFSYSNSSPFNGGGAVQSSSVITSRTAAASTTTPPPRGMIHHHQQSGEAGGLSTSERVRLALQASSQYLSTAISPSSATTVQ